MTPELQEMVERFLVGIERIATALEIKAAPPPDRPVLKYHGPQRESSDAERTKRPKQASRS